ncbi:hypothetical protein A2U01_0035746, partial [Trifolium medium]|nr:hypothetical protein [Trifolium medium]
VLISRLESGFTQPDIEKICSNVKVQGKSKTSIKTVDQAIHDAGASAQPRESKLKDVKEETKSRKRTSGSSNETTSKRMKTTITITDDEEVPEVPLQRKKSTSDVGTHAPNKEKKDQASDSHEEKKDRKRKDKKKEKSQHT